MNDAIIEIGDPDINEERVIQPLQFKFSKQLIKNIKKHLQNDKDNIASATLILDCYLDNYKVYLKNIIKYWSKDYNFYKQEKVFNQFPHFYTTIDDLKIHYIHVKPNNPDEKPVYPLLMLHGWPSSVLEFYDVIPYLINATEENNFIFEVIIPSLPGFGGSDCPSHENLKCDFIAELLVKLMKVLGHEQFYIHCDDWCVFIVLTMFVKYVANLLAVHYALCQVNEVANLSQYTAKRIANIRDVRTQELMLKNEYYNSPTSLCAHTLGMGALHSPVTLLAYLFEKFVKDSIHANTIDVLNDYKYRNFINNVMMYWATNSILKILKAYSGYFSFDEYYNEYKELESQYNNFVRITLFIPKDVCSNITIETEENISIFWKNSRFPAIEAPATLSRAIFCHFKRFLVQNVAD